MSDPDLSATPLPADTVGLLEGLASTRAIRRYTDDPVPPEALRAMLFAATRAPSGSNRQPFRFVVLTDGPKALEAKRLIAEAGQRIWSNKREHDGYDAGSGVVDDSPKARMARTMQHYVDHFASAPVLVLPCLVRYREPTPLEGASIFPACQNLLLAARALGLGAVLTTQQFFLPGEFEKVLGLPSTVTLAAIIPVGWPTGKFGPTQRPDAKSVVSWDRYDT